jgi:hypothetical protein
MKPIIHSYVIFDSSEAFEKWQMEHADVTVAVIQPIVTGFDMQQTSIATMEAVTTKAKVFVTYWRDRPCGGN